MRMNCKSIEDITVGHDAGVEEVDIMLVKERDINHVQVLHLDSLLVAQPAIVVKNVGITVCDALIKLLSGQVIPALIRCSNISVVINDFG